MKTIRTIFFLLLVAVIGAPTLSAQTKKEKKEMKQKAVRELVLSEKYKIAVIFYLYLLFRPFLGSNQQNTV